MPLPIYIVSLFIIFLDKKAQCINKDSVICDTEARERDYRNRRYLADSIKTVLNLERKIQAIEDAYMKKTSESQRKIHVATSNAKQFWPTVYD